MRYRSKEREDHAGGGPASEPREGDGGGASHGRDWAGADDPAWGGEGRYIASGGGDGGEGGQPADFRGRAGEDEPLAAGCEGKRVGGFAVYALWDARGQRRPSYIAAG